LQDFKENGLKIKEGLAWTTARSFMGLSNHSPNYNFNLVFGSEVMLPFKVQLPSLRVAMQFTDPDENTQVRLAKLEALDELS